MTPWLISISSAYLLGSIPFGYLLVRAFRKQDIRATGSGNIGATNVARSGAKGLAIATLLLDLGKGAAAVILAFLLARHTPTFTHAFTRPQAFDLASIAALAAVLGHVFPVWLSFRGGKGVATALGVFLVLVPRAALAAAAVFLLAFLLTRYVSLASILSAVAFPLFALYFVSARTPLALLGLIAIPAIVILKHHANIRRLLAGTESRFGRTANKVPA